LQGRYDEITKLYDFHARQYDAALGRWFGTDPKAGVMPYNSPYVAMMNNPVSFTYPDGECPICMIALIGAAISGASYTAGVALSSGGFNNWNWGQFGKSLAIGAVSGVFTAGIGTAVGSFGSQGLGTEFARALMHGLANMTIGAMFGQDPSIANFASGALGSLAGSATHNLNGAIQIGSSAVVGGISVEMSGGDFWRGAAIGGTVAGLNHVRHQVKLNNHVKAVMAFLEDSGFPSIKVRSDVVMHKDSFWTKYYAQFVGDISDYGDFFSNRGLKGFDSRSFTFDAYTSKSKTAILGGSGRRDGEVRSLALKYYPSRGNSIGLVASDIGHILESGFANIDGRIINSITGKNGDFYDMHNYNSNFYLKYRNWFR
jgi:RHS repeat-associated protein